MTGAAGALPAGCTSNGCVFVMLIAGAGAGAGRGRTLIRAVSFFGPPLVEVATELPPAAIPGGFGNGWRSGDAPDNAAMTGRRGTTTGASGGASAAGAGIIFGGNRGIGVAGPRLGRTMRAVSRFATPGADPACSGRGGSAIRTVSFFGSAMGDQTVLGKIAQTPVACHLFIWSTAVPAVRRIGVSPVLCNNDNRPDACWPHSRDGRAPTPANRSRGCR